MPSKVEQLGDNVIFKDLDKPRIHSTKSQKNPHIFKSIN